MGNKTCGINAAIDEAKAAIDQLKAKLSEGVNGVGDLGSLADTIKNKLSEINTPQIPSINLQEELAKLPTLTPEEYTAAVQSIKEKFGSAVDNLDDIIAKIPKPFGIEGTDQKDIFAELRAAVDGFGAAFKGAQETLNNLSIESAVAEICKGVPNYEVTTTTRQEVRINPTTQREEIVTIIVVSPPEEKPKPPVTPQKNPEPDPVPQPRPAPTGGFCRLEPKPIDTRAQEDGIGVPDLDTRAQEDGIGVPDLDTRGQEDGIGIPLPDTRTDENGIAIPPRAPRPAPAPVPKPTPVTPAPKPVVTPTPPAPPPVTATAAPGAYEFKFTKDKLAKAISKRASEWHDAMTTVLPKYGITTPERVAVFLGQLVAEAGEELSNLREFSQYSPKAYFGICKKRLGLNSIDDCAPYLASKEKTFLGLYEATLDGNFHYLGKSLHGSTIEKGDGAKFIGRGLKQLTGKANYTRASKEIYGDDRLVKNPELVATDKAVALETACWFWKSRNLNSIADTYKTDPDKCVTQVTKLVNGGDIGLAVRKDYAKRAYAVFNA